MLLSAASRRQLRAVLHKNWLLTVRVKSEIGRELGAPAVLLVVVILLTALLPGGIHAPVPVYPPGALAGAAAAGGGGGAVAFTPCDAGAGNASDGGLVAALAARVGAAAGVRTVCVPCAPPGGGGWADAPAACRAAVLAVRQAGTAVFAGVHVHTPRSLVLGDVSGTTATTILYDAAALPLAGHGSGLSSRAPGSGGPDAGAAEYLSGFLALQDAVGAAAVRMRTGAPPALALAATQVRRVARSPLHVLCVRVCVCVCVCVCAPATRACARAAQQFPSPAYVDATGAAVFAYVTPAFMFVLFTFQVRLRAPVAVSQCARVSE